jgi:hypothetical protein
MEKTHKDDKRNEDDVGEEVARLAEAWRIKFKASTVRPHWAQSVRDILQENMNFVDSLEYRSKTNQTEPLVRRNGVKNLQISGSGSLKIHGRWKRTPSVLISMPWQSKDSTNVAATSVLEIN